MSKLSKEDLIQWGSVEAHKQCFGQLPPQDGSSLGAYSHKKALENMTNAMYETATASVKPAISFVNVLAVLLFIVSEWEEVEK